MALNPEGDELAVADRRACLHIVDSATGSELRHWALSEPIEHLRWLAVPGWLGTVVEGAALVLDATDGRMLERLDASQGLAWRAEVPWPYETSLNPYVRPWFINVPGAAKLATAEWSPDGRWLAYIRDASAPGTQPTGAPEPGEATGAAARTPSAQLPARGDGDQLLLYDVSRQRVTAELPTEAHGLTLLQWAEGSGQVATATPDGVVDVWDVTSGRRVGRCESCRQQQTRLSPDGLTLASSSTRYPLQLQVRDVRSGRPEHVIETDYRPKGLVADAGNTPTLLVVSWSPDGRYAAVQSVIAVKDHLYFLRVYETSHWTMLSDSSRFVDSDWMGVLRKPRVEPTLPGLAWNPNASEFAALALGLSGQGVSIFD